MEKWNYENCLIEAKKYKSVTEFHKGSKGAYKKAWQNGWLADYTFFVNPRQIWTQESCFEEAKKYTYKSEFKEKSGSAYNVARKNGWIKDYSWLKNKRKPKDYWDEERCYEEAKKYEDLLSFSRTVPGQVATKKGWVNNYDWLTRVHVANGYWTKERCIEEAKKYATCSEFRKNASGAYGAVKTNGWLEEIWDLGIWERQCKPNGYWDEERCYEEAKNYTSRWEFEQNCPAAKAKALKNGWIENYTWFSPPKNKIKWDYNTCCEESRKYNSVWDFHNKSSGAYHKAYDEGWLYDFKWLFANSNYNSKKYRFNLLEEFTDEYRLREWLTIADVNIIHIILRNLQQCKSDYIPIIKEIDKLVDRGSSDPIKDLEDKYCIDNGETINYPDSTMVVTIEDIDLDDDDAVETVITSIDTVKREPTIDEITRAEDIQFQIIDEIESMVTPEDKQYLRDKFLNDKIREWMKNRDKK